MVKTFRRVCISCRIESSYSPHSNIGISEESSYLSDIVYIDNTKRSPYLSAARLHEAIIGLK